MSRYFICTAIVCGLLFTSVVISAPSIEEGKSLFANRCASCHNINKDLTGPALAKVDERRTIEWIIKFVHSPQGVIKSNDAYATTLYNKYNRIIMPDHLDLTDDNIKSIVQYIRSEAKQVSTEKPPFPKPGKLRPTYVPLTIANNYFFFISFLVSVALLVMVMLFAVQVKIIERKRAGEIMDEVG